MRIRTTKQMRLDELIKYVWKNGIESDRFYCDTQSAFVRIIDGGVFSNYRYTEEDTFTVEVEEELTEDTEFKELVELYRDCNSNELKLITAENISISNFKKAEHKPFKSLSIYHKDTLIWSRDTGIPAEGVIKA